MSRGRRWPWSSAARLSTALLHARGPTAQVLTSRSAVAAARANKDTFESDAEKQAESDRKRIERLARDKERQQRKRAIAASVRQGTPLERAERQHGKPAAPSEPKRGALSHPIMSFATEHATGDFVDWRSGGELDTAEYVRERNKLPPVTSESEHAIRVRTPTLECGLRLAGDSYDDADVVARVADIAAELDIPRHEVIKRLDATPPGDTCVFTIESSPLDDQHIHPTEFPWNAPAQPVQFSEADLHADEEQP